MAIRVTGRGRDEVSNKLYLEDNFTQVPNEILEALARTYLSPNEWKIVILAIRKTYGWHKPDDWIALSQIEKHTGITRSNVCRYIKSLVRRNILVRSDYMHAALEEDTTKWLDKVSSVSTTGCYQY